MGTTKRNTKKKRQLLAIDLGSDSVKCVVGQELGQTLKIQSLFTETLPKDVYENGNILDAQALKTIVLSALKKNRMSVKDVAITIESSELIKREMEIPKVPKEDQADLIAYEVAQYLPIDTSAYVLQHIVLEDFKQEDVEKTKVLLGAMPKEMVESHLDWVKSLGLNPLFLDMHSNSLEKLIAFSLSKQLYADQKTTAVIDFGHKMIDIGIYENGEYRFNRLLRMGGNAMTQFLSKHLELSEDEARKQKEKTSIRHLSEMYHKATDRSDPKDMVVMDSVDYLNECLDEISKVFKYYTSRSHTNQINEVWIHGGTSKYLDLCGYAEERLGYKVELLNKLPNVEFAIKSGQEDLPRYINAIGAIIRR